MVDTIRTTLGPRGMDKLVHDDRVGALAKSELSCDCFGHAGVMPLTFCHCMQGKVTISNDGATIMKLLDIVHPAAKVLADISMSQDAEVSGCADYAHLGGVQLGISIENVSCQPPTMTYAPT